MGYVGIMSRKNKMENVHTPMTENPLKVTVMS